MDASIFVSPSNIEDITIKILFLQLSDIKKEYLPQALACTDKLSQVWYDYAHAHTKSRLKVAILMQAANNMLQILKPSTKQRLFKHYLQKQKIAA